MWAWRWPLQPDPTFTAPHSISFVYRLQNGTWLCCPNPRSCRTHCSKTQSPPCFHLKCIAWQFILSAKIFLPFIYYFSSAAATGSSALTPALLHRMTHTPLAFPCKHHSLSQSPSKFHSGFILPKDGWWELSIHFQMKVQLFLVQWQEQFLIFSGSSLPDKPYDLIWLLCSVLKGV